LSIVVLLASGLIRAYPRKSLSLSFQISVKALLFRYHGDHPIPSSSVARFLGFLDLSDGSSAITQYYRKIL
jgi:hypothetical protein